MPPLLAVKRKRLKIIGQKCDAATKVPQAYSHSKFLAKDGENCHLYLQMNLHQLKIPLLKCSPTNLLPTIIN